MKIKKVGSDKKELFKNITNIILGNFKNPFIDKIEKESRNEKFFIIKRILILVSSNLKIINFIDYYMNNKYEYDFKIRNFFNTIYILLKSNLFLNSQNFVYLKYYKSNYKIFRESITDLNSNETIELYKLYNSGIHLDNNVKNNTEENCENEEVICNNVIVVKEEIKEEIKEEHSNNNNINYEINKKYPQIPNDKILDKPNENLTLFNVLNLNDDLIYIFEHKKNHQKYFIIKPFVYETYIKYGDLADNNLISDQIMNDKCYLSKIERNKLLYAIKKKKRELIR